MLPESAPFLPRTLDDVQKNYLLTDLLRGVSRSFYLTLRVLPSQLREPISVAYLLARAADTIADTAIVSAGKRCDALNHLRGQLQSDVPSHAVLERLQTGFTGQLDHAFENELLVMLSPLFELLLRQTAPDRTMIRKVVLTLTEGMVSDLESFPVSKNSGEVVAIALERGDQLDCYTYLVAGCVGEFWTDISIAHIDALQCWQASQKKYSQLGVRFGKGLQLTNILRDVPRDLRVGRCYLPQSWLNEVSLMPDDLMNATNSATARPLLLKGIHRTLDHYAAAEQYVVALPRRCVRLRIAALWPMLIGLKTLAQLSQQSNWLDVTVVCKVERKWIYRMMLLSSGVVFSNLAVKWWCARLRKSVLLT
ncbi:MAG: squalene/phytoene synthase family protein [Gammaproteobacteria bacterium]|nr:squalene/phytoene synthase family protein [Gammaproteobacteria bacterium]